MLTLLKHFTIHTIRYPGGKSLYVDTLANVLNNGESWLGAYNDLQWALQTAGCGDTVHVAEGIYYPTTDGNRDSAFYLASGVTIMGGYPTGGGDMDSRDALSFATILSGNIGHPDSVDDNSYHILKLDSSQKAIVLDGLSLTAARADGPDENAAGGALYNRGKISLNNMHIYEITGQESGYVIFNRGQDALLTIQNSKLNFVILPDKDALLNKEDAKIFIQGEVNINK